MGQASRLRSVWQIGAMLIAGCGGSGLDPEAMPGAALGSNQAEAAVISLRPEQDDDVDRAVRDLGLVDPDRSVRITTATGASGWLSADQIGSAMLDPSATVRRAAIEGLLGTGSNHVATFIPQLRLALDDPESSVREAVVEVLAECRDPRAVALLLEARGDASPIVREEAAQALYRLGRKVPG